ncbi:hypothetical protein L210DRAFT_3646321 [Boletus edulis BED1]|uniref:Uncharacterized protein n=1 Tax=Boletus edulis BED1 TaxID=1328754 RepID=A0AAD4GDD3_BOLED|nr:hypothetical protein L210DRAFT_3646321 [Boletus edulis BED1]
MNCLWEQIMLEMQVQMEKMQTSKTAEIEAQVEMHVTQLQDTMQAEKEQELASLKQCYSHNNKNGQVQQLLKERLDITQDINIITHELADVAEVHKYKYEDGPGPDPTNLVFDLTRNHSTPWNMFILNLLTQELQERCVEEQWVIMQSDNYILDILRDCYK